MEPITGEYILQGIKERSNGVALAFDEEYGEDLEKLVEDVAESFEVLRGIIDREVENQVAENDYQSVLLFWTALNTYISAIELFRRGYFKEPPMLLRNMVEVFGVAYDIHIHPERLNLLRELRGRYNSQRSINMLKSIHPIIGAMYGRLSNTFTHVNALHILPQGSYTGSNRTLWIGGGFSESDRKQHIFSLSALRLALDLLNATLEFTLYEEIEQHRYWTKELNGRYKHQPNNRIRTHAHDIMKRFEALLQDKGEEN